MSVFDELDEKAREFAAKARAALDNPDEFMARTRERVEEAVGEAKEDLEEFAKDAEEEFKGIRERMADFLECGPKAEKAATPEPTKPPEEPTPPADPA
ncbi:MAG: hypothetical protein V4558_14765 [Gemmatimonadota bacterium]